MTAGEAQLAQPDFPGHRCCAVPVGRTGEFFDIDIVVDIQARQSCLQLCLNEGDLKFGRLEGADASHDQCPDVVRSTKDDF